jgi:hypothetical protein
VTFIDVARKVAEGATDAPWEPLPNDRSDLEGEWWVEMPGLNDSTLLTEADATLIAFMRNHWDAMVDVVEAAGDIEHHGYPDWKPKDGCDLCAALARLEAITKEAA